MSRHLRSRSFPALGTTAVVAVTDEDALAPACATLEEQLRQLDATCSRFRTDSELSLANARAGEVVSVSPLFAELLTVALTAAAASDGRVDPTLGSELRAAGYDQTFSLVRERATWVIGARLPREPQWRLIRLDPEQLTLQTPPGIELDLGATAKAWAADRAVAAIAGDCRGGVLVSLGGDIAVGGVSPESGWPIRVAADHAAPLDGAGPVVSIVHGGLATSTTTVRRWSTDRGSAHHLLDPATGLPAPTVWHTVSVAAATCFDANVAATASVVLGDAAPGWLEDRQLPARLVRADGDVVYTGGWPVDRLAA